MTQARTQVAKKPRQPPCLAPKDANSVEPRSRVIPIRAVAGPSNMVDVSIPSGQHTLRVTVYRGRAARLATAGPGQRLYNAGRGLVMVLEFPFAEGRKADAKSTH